MITNLFLAAAFTLVVGDSHVKGFPGDLLCRSIRADGGSCLNVGSKGMKAIDLANHPVRLRHLDNYRVILMLGSNDPQDYRTIHAYRLLYKLYPDALLIGPPAYKGWLGVRVNVIARIQQQEFGKRWIDSRECTKSFKGRVGVHFRKSGAKEWIDCVKNRVSK